MGDFVRQFLVLAWKNRILKLRNWSVLLLELIPPIVVLLGMWGIITAIKATVTDAIIPSVSSYSSTLTVR